MNYPFDPEEEELENGTIENEDWDAWYELQTELNLDQDE